MWLATSNFFATLKLMLIYSFFDNKIVAVYINHNHTYDQESKHKAT